MSLWRRPRKGPMFRELPAGGGQPAFQESEEQKLRPLTIDFDAEVDGLFDDSSVPADGQPVAVILWGGIATGKTTIRKQKYSTGYVLIDAADIFINLSRGRSLPFPGPLEEPMNLIGRLVANRALSERRNIVTEIIGADAREVTELIEALRSLGYNVQGVGVTCDVEEAVRRNETRGTDDISAYHAEPFQQEWIFSASQELAPH